MNITVLVPNQLSKVFLQENLEAYWIRIFSCTCSALGTTDMKYLSRMSRSPSDTDENPALSGNISTGFPDFVKPPDKQLIYNKTKFVGELTNLAAPQYSSWRGAGRHGGRHWGSSPGTGPPPPGAPGSAATRAKRPGSPPWGAGAAASRTSCQHHSIFCKTILMERNLIF